MHTLAKLNLTTPTKVTFFGLVVCTVAIWIQWLSGDPAYPTFPPGPVFFIAVALLVALGSRWWWTPLLGALLSALVTVGWFETLPVEILRLTHPVAVGKFPLGIFVGTLAQIIALLVTDIAGTMAAAQNYRRSQVAFDKAKTLCKIVGAPFVVIGLTLAVRSVSVDKYHNLLHLIWGVTALTIGFLGSRLIARSFLLGSGAFFLLLGGLGMLIGDPEMNRAWHIGGMHLQTSDHIFHIVFGPALLSAAYISGWKRLDKSSMQSVPTT